MKSSFKVQSHPNQEDKSGHPTFASPTQINYSANEPRLLEEQRESTHETIIQKILNLFREKK